MDVLDHLYLNEIKEFNLRVSQRIPNIEGINDVIELLFDMRLIIKPHMIKKIPYTTDKFSILVPKI